MKIWWNEFKCSLFSYKFSFFDLAMIWSITTIAEVYSYWLLALVIPMAVFSTVMEWRVREENEDAQASNGTVG